MSDIFKRPLTHISSIPKGGVEWLLVMLEQVLDVSKAFNLEDLRFLLNYLPEASRQSDYSSTCMPLAWVRLERVKVESNDIKMLHDCPNLLSSGHT